jgi:hypothetical protein
MVHKAQGDATCLVLEWGGAASTGWCSNKHAAVLFVRVVVVVVLRVVHDLRSVHPMLPPAPSCFKWSQGQYNIVHLEPRATVSTPTVFLQPGPHLLPASLFLPSHGCTHGATISFPLLFTWCL